MAKIKNNDTMIVGDLSTHWHQWTDHPDKINKVTVVLNNTTDQLDLIAIYRTLNPKTAEYTFFSSAHGTFSWTDHILGHKTSLNKFKRKKLYQAFFF